MNKITLIGNLTHDPETRTTPNGVTVCTFTIAVNRRFASQGGERQTDFFRVNAWRQLGDTCARYLAKGRKVAVIGELQARQYEAKDGTTRMSLDVSADEVEFLTPRTNEEGTASGYSAPRPSAPAQDLSGFTDINADELPF
jgi:single stranded DNA-binding protein (ssb)